MAIKFYDTNALLNLQERAFEEKFVISHETLRELEDIKIAKNKDAAIKHQARRVVRLLGEREDGYEVVIVPYREDIVHLPSTPDIRICYAAYVEYNKRNNNLVFVTDDLSLRNIARKVFQLPVVFSSTEERIYKGYKELTGTTEYINDMMGTQDYINSFIENEYLIMHNTDTQQKNEMRYTDGYFTSLRLPPQKFLKGKNSLQRCAIDILMNNEITIAAIMGSYGSGKSFLSTRMGLYHINEKGTQTKMLMIREPVGEGREVGYLQGGFDEKTEAFFLPIVQQLDGGEFELERLKQRGAIEATIPYYMKGTTYNDSILLVDEAEDLTEKQLRLIGTRVGENSRIFLSGDYKQSVVNDSEHNALIHMCNELKGNPLFGTIYLGEDVRSSTSKVFANLFED